MVALPLGLKPHHVETFRECRLTDVGESELTNKKEKTCARYKIAFAEWTIYNKGDLQRKKLENF